MKKYKDCKWYREQGQHMDDECELEIIVWGYPYKCCKHNHCRDYQDKESINELNY